MKDFWDAACFVKVGFPCQGPTALAEQDCCIVKTNFSSSADIPLMTFSFPKGPMSTRERDVCETCGQDGFNCRGHCGHIEIPLPIYNPIFYDVLKRLLSVICPSCFRLQVEGI